MTSVSTPSAAPRRESQPEPLRRKRAQPTPSPTPRRRRLLNRLLIFATIVLLVDALVGDRGVVERARARRVYQQEAAALEVLKAENNALRDRIHRLRDDPAAIESIAREDLGLIRPGELLFIIRDLQKPAVAH